MEEQGRTFKKLFCPICDSEVDAEYQGIFGSMHRYICPNKKELGDKKKEEHGIYIPISDNNTYKSASAEKEEIPNTEYSKIYVNGIGTFKEDKNSFNDFFKTILQGMGISSLLYRTSLNHINQKEDTENREHKIDNSNIQKDNADNHSNSQKDLDTNESDFASIQQLEIPNIDIPKSIDIDIPIDYPDPDGLPNFDCDMDSINSDILDIF